MLLSVPSFNHVFSAAQKLPLGRAVPHRVVIHRVQKRHIVIVIILYYQLRRQIGDHLLVHSLLPVRFFLYYTKWIAVTQVISANFQVIFDILLTVEIEIMYNNNKI